MKTLLPRWVKEMVPRTVLPFLGSTLATAIVPASGTSLRLGGMLSHAPRNAAPASTATEAARRQDLRRRAVGARAAPARLPPVGVRAARIGVRIW
jgi:hypothetical protein